ncbi:MAG: histidinol-phosphate transaminase [Oligoflexia bacterium]|nr:histidinol-phosphate transaminase [Oligoflexia bacterium]
MRNLLRDPLLNFKPYVAGKPIEEVRRQYNLTGRIAKLASNENPLGTSPLALKAMHEELETVSLYPDDHAWAYRNKVAKMYGVTMDNVFAGGGSVEILELVGLAFLTPNDNVVTSDRTFAAYHLAAAKMGAKCKLAEMTDGGYRYDLKALAAQIDSQTKVVFLANPTNPTGTWFTRDEFDELMAKIPQDVLVVYDSAYEEYCTASDMPDPMSHFRKGRRLLYLRTLSKVYGLAGVRIGYGVGPTDIIHGLMTCRFSFNTSRIAQAGAIAALDDEEFVARSREHNAKELDFLRAGLAKLPVTVPPSRTNFLLVDTAKKADWLFAELQKRGVIVRPMGGYGMPQAIRVSTGLREDNEAFLHHLGELLRS